MPTSTASATQAWSIQGFFSRRRSTITPTIIVSCIIVPSSTHRRRNAERQAGDEVLGLQLDRPVRRHGKDEPDRSSTDLRPHLAGIPEAEPEEGHDAAGRIPVEFEAVPERVADPGRLGVQADEPGPAVVLHPFDLPDLHPAIHMMLVRKSVV